MGLFDLFRKSDDTPPPPRPANGWRPGDRVLAHWPPEPFFYPATVRKVDARDADRRRYFIQFDDGDSAWLFDRQVRSFALPDGARVEGRWKGGPGYFPGRITGQKTAHGEITIHISYDDGDKEWTTTRFVRLEKAGSGPSAQRLKDEEARQSQALIATLDIQDADEALRALDALEAEVADRTMIHFYRATHLARAGKHAEALVEVETCLESMPARDVRASALALRTDCRIKTGDHATAEAELREVLAAAPADADVLCKLAQVLLFTNRRHEAVEVAQQCIALKPGSATLVVAHMVCGYAYDALNQYHDALPHFDACIRLSPDSDEPRRERGLCLYSMGRKDEALEDLNIAVEFRNCLVSRICRAKIYEERGEYQDALADYEHVAANTTDHFVRADIVRVLERMGRHDDARKAHAEHFKAVVAELRDVSAKGVKMKPGFVMANGVLFDPSSKEHSFCCVVASFDPRMTPTRLAEIGRWLMTFKDTEQTDPVLRQVAALTTAERATRKRYPVPPQFTDGIEVFTVSLYAFRPFLNGAINGDTLWCAIERDPKGRAVMLPAPGCPALAAKK